MVTASAVVVLSTVIMFAQAFNIETNHSPTEKNNGSKLAEKVPSTSERTAAQPISMFLEETNSTYRSVNVEFAYDDNHKFKNPDHKKYNLLQSEIKQISTDGSQNMAQKDVRSKKSKIETESKNVTNNNNVNNNPAKPVVIDDDAEVFISKIQRKQEWAALEVEEESPIMGKLPKYMYDALQPVPPFDEIGKKNNENRKNNLLQAQIPHLHAQRNQPPFVAGPVVYPVSIYNRQFKEPFFVS